MEPNLQDILARLNREPDTRYGFCRCGCGQKAPIPRVSDTTKGYIVGDPLPYRKGHQNRVLTSVHVDSKSGCWVWLKSTNTHGYGQSSKSSRGGTISAHVLVWNWAYGPVPQGFELDHLCRNRPCVNPAHLRIVTSVENTRCGAKTKLTEASVREIRSLGERGETQRSIASRFNVSHRTIGDILTRKLWKDID